MTSAVIALAMFAAPAFAATTVVHPGDMQGWGFAQETPTGTGAMVSGPEDPPLGQGSANLVVDSTGGVVLGKAGYQGLRLNAITNLEYSTYRTSGGDALAIALQFNIDADVTDNSDDFQGRLVYEPYYTHTVTTGEWQTWDPMDDAGAGNWWFSNAALAAASGCSIAAPCTWTEVLLAFPNAGIHNTLGAVYLKAGGGWAGGFDGNVDALTINDDTYDFELVNEPASKDDCKNEGWKTLTDDNGDAFRNQGQCVSYANGRR